ncbi:crossover junction endodeoxyribonuclease RuvC [bacterium]|nr:crossover junction endodeoxyribonuclease RuvC [bacterium]|tara:strand:+ start:247 stop:732 length:486 start_codon:yes stop_codon:yes gene_type:complete
MIILGLDPGIGTTGWGCIKDERGNLEHVGHGVISTPPNTDDAKRLIELKTKVDALLTEHKPELVGIEQLLFGRNVSTAMSVGQARGVLVLACQQAGAAIVEVKPNQVKQAVTGYGAAKKGQVQQMVKTILSLAKNPTPDDAADALAVAICTASQKNSHAHA